MNNKHNEKGQNSPLANEIANLPTHELLKLLTPHQKNEIFEKYGVSDALDVSKIAEAVKYNGLFYSVYSAYDMIIRYAIFELREAGQGSLADTIMAVYDIIYNLQQSRIPTSEPTK